MAAALPLQSGMHWFSAGLSRHGRRPEVWVGLVVTVLAYFTYFHGYWDPPNFFWDENYHVASAQKYLHGTFFMEPHPPLGKLLIALGEKLVGPEGNGSADQFLATHHAPDTPPGFSMVGYRLFPALLGWLSAPLLFCVFLLIARSALVAGLLTFPYIFDNALIVQSRAAMLESALAFFSLAMVALFLLLLARRDRPKRVLLLSTLLGGCFAAVLTTKVLGLVMVLLYLPLLWIFVRDFDVPSALRNVALPSAAGFAIVFLAVWQAHFALAATVNSGLSNEGYFRASTAYKQVLNDGETASIGHFGLMLRDSLAFIPQYARGVPKLDLCKSGENGSPWFFWPVGGRAINYRWETTGGDAEATYRYIYLQSNPIAWFLGFAAVILAASMLLASVMLPLRRPLEHRFLLTVFLGLYLSYMAAVSQIDRVMYLYHYFLPLLFSFILLGVVVMQVRQIAGWHLDGRRRMVVLAWCSAAVVAGFLFYRPLTYYGPLTDAAFARRSLLRIWDLHCVRCDQTSSLVRKTCS